MEENNGVYEMRQHGVSLPFTIGDLLDVCHLHPECTVKFGDAGWSPGELVSWRGAYHLPAICPTEEKRTGREVAEGLIFDLSKPHRGYKGGEYHYTTDDVFYVSPYGEARDAVVFRAELIKDSLFLLLREEPW